MLKSSILQMLKEHHLDPLCSDYQIEVWGQGRKLTIYLSEETWRVNVIKSEGTSFNIKSMDDIENCSNADIREHIEWLLNKSNQV